jgi:Ca2+-binding RTX toxin-like protein
METLTSDDNATWTTKHSGIGGHSSQGQLNYVPDTADGFHTYGALWTPADLVYYIDGVEVMHTPTPADMNKPMFMIANLAMGGWGGAIDQADLPAEMKIDYIHAYALPGATTPTATTAPAPVPTPSPVPAPAPAPAPSVVAPAAGDAFDGTSGADTLQGGAARDHLWGGDGDDRISGGGEFDNLHGNVGNDTVAGGAGDDWVVGGKDNDLLSGDDGGDVVLGNLGDDRCDGSAGADVVRGGQGNDVVLGQDGDDWLSGDRGNDTVTGGSGADIFHGFGDAGLDRITDFNFAEGDRVQLIAGTVWHVSQVDQDVVIDMSGGAQMVLEHVQLGSLGDGWIFGA